MYMGFDHSIYVEVGIENVLAVRLLSSAIVVKLSSCLRVQFEPSERNIQFHCCSINFVPCIIIIPHFPPHFPGQVNFNFSVSNPVIKTCYKISLVQGFTFLADFALVTQPGYLGEVTPSVNIYTVVNQ